MHNWISSENLSCQSTFNFPILRKWISREFQSDNRGGAGELEFGFFGLKSFGEIVTEVETKRKLSLTDALLTETLWNES